MNVFCYFEEIPGISPDHQLLDQWLRSWMHFGWEPQILTYDDALAGNPEAVKVMDKSPELGRGPCPEGYNRATHHRWAAMEKRGGLIVDYDVINNGFTGEMLEEAMGDSSVFTPVFLNASPCCCAVYASTLGAQVIVQTIMQHADEEQRFAVLRQQPPWRLDKSKELSFVCHDQAIFERFQERWYYPPKSYVVEYRNDGWREAPLIHFCNAKTKSPRSNVVRMLRLAGLQ